MAATKPNRRPPWGALAAGLLISALAFGVAGSLQPAPALDKPPGPPTCVAAGPASLAKAAPKVRAVIPQITPVTSLVAENWQNAVLVHKPLGSPAGVDYDLRVFLAPAHARVSDLLKPGHSVQELQVLAAERPSDATIKAFGLAKPDDWYQVRLDKFSLQDEGLHLTATDHVLLVFACDAQNGVAATGQAAIEVGNWWVSLAAAFAVGLVIYLGAALAAWSFRRKLSDPRKVQPPLRWRTVARYSFWRCLDPVVITADIFDRGSLSKLQVLVFSLVIVVFLAMVAMSTGVLQDISPTIAFLLGLPALGAIGTQVAAVTRDRMSVENWAWLVSHGVLPVNDGGADQPRWRDLFVNDDEIDLYKVQAAGFSIVVLYGMFRAGASHITQFAVPDSIITILGLSQVVLVGGRYTKPTTLKELNELVDELRKRKEELRQAIGSGTDVDAEGKPGTPSSPPAAGPFLTLDAAYHGGLPRAVSRYRDTAAQVEIVLEGLTHRDVQAGVLSNLDPSSM